MQTELASRMEKIWGMAQIALAQGSLDYGIAGHSRIAKLAGLSFKFIDDQLSRVCGGGMDISIRRKDMNDNIILFPGMSRTTVEFLTGDDDLLDRLYAELASLNATLSARRAA